MSRLLNLFVLNLVATAGLAQSFAGAEALDSLLDEAIKNDEAPGAVILVGHKGHVVYEKAYGLRAVVPKAEPMTVDTIFDAASLTKVIATTSSVMKMFEQGKIRLTDPVTRYLPEFQGGKSNVTIRQLLTHFSGLAPDVDLEPAWSGYETGIRKALVYRPAAQPGEKFIYSDINFILLGEIVHRLSGKPLDAYARENIFLPLGMKDSMFRPPVALRPRIAPTEIIDGGSQPLRGVVHDPTTRYMGGVAGHAGLFTTARDLGRFAEMLLAKGTAGDVHLFSPLTVHKFTEPGTPPDQPILRALGFDMDSSYSGNRGELFPLGSYGHTGFTGTSLWIDPSTQSYVILLTSSRHPHARPPVNSLRSRVATVAAASFGIDVPGVLLTGYNETLLGPGIYRPVSRNAAVQSGLDVLEAERFARLRTRRIGLITNHTGINRAGKRNLDVMIAAGIRPVALFSPEHGIAGREDKENVDDAKDEATGVPVWSLYAGSNRRPNTQMLRGIDTLVFDIQDIGSRYYTYLCTMRNAMEEAASNKIRFVVLDRPNPITGVHVEGPVLEPALESFVGCFPMPIRHGMTAGEVARMMNGELRLGVDLQVVSMRNWQRGDWFDSTGLVWTDPSPNMRSLNAALLYPAVAMLEASANYSVGRGTDAPFEQIGADWIDGSRLSAYLNRRYVPGIRTYPTRFRPTVSNFKDQMISGVRFVVTDRDLFDSARLGLELAAALDKLYPGKIVWETNLKLIGNRSLIKAIQAGEEPRTIRDRQDVEIREFLSRRARYLLY